MYLFFKWRKYPHNIILEAWTKTNIFNREQLLSTKDTEHKDVPLMFITTYNTTNPNFKELISKHWAYLGRSSATREFGKRDFKITYRKPPSLKDMLVSAKIAQEVQPIRVARDPILANIAKKFHNQGNKKTHTTKIIIQ